MSAWNEISGAHGGIRFIWSLLKFSVGASLWIQEKILNQDKKLNEDEETSSKVMVSEVNTGVLGEKANTSVNMCDHNQDSKLKLNAWNEVKSTWMLFLPPIGLLELLY